MLQAREAETMSPREAGEMPKPKEASRAGRQL